VEEGELVRYLEQGEEWIKQDNQEQHQSSRSNAPLSSSSPAPVE
jgi:hypothetical protein